MNQQTPKTKKFSKLLLIAYYDNHLPNSLEKNFNTASSKFVQLQPIKIQMRS